MLLLTSDKVICLSNKGDRSMAEQNDLKELASQALQPAELVEYQEGAVVSRTLVKKEQGTVTLFAFDKGEGLSEHTAPFDALVQILEGEAEITISGKPIRAGAGQLVIMPADEPHALQAVEPFKMMLIMVRA
jgi:quercetin dioxygenase-like cupin family protein